jgi:tetratricopeptide (TPR) repeat protein
MKTFFGILLLIIFIHNSITGQQKPETFVKASFEKAKIYGEDASKFFVQNIQFPYNSLIAGYSDGSVFVSFIIMDTGQIDSVEVINEPGELFKGVVLNALEKSSGLWRPTRFDDLALGKKYIAGFNFSATNAFFVKKDKSFRYFKRGNMGKALKLINEALKLDPYDIELYQDRALIYKKQNKHDLEALDLAKCYVLNNNVLFDIWFQAVPQRVFH